MPEMDSSCPYWSRMDGTAPSQWSEQCMVMHCELFVPKGLYALLCFALGRVLLWGASLISGLSNLSGLTLCERCATGRVRVVPPM